MIHIQIPQGHLNYILREMPDLSMTPKFRAALAAVEGPRQVQLALCTKEIDEVIEALGNRFLTVGIQEDCELNPEGHYIENLVDVFGVQEYWDTQEED